MMPTQRRQQYRVLTAVKFGPLRLHAGIFLVLVRNPPVDQFVSMYVTCSMRCVHVAYTESSPLLPRQA